MPMSIDHDWWRNCEFGPDDPEIPAIDAMESAIAPLDDETATIRRYITALELCHHKAERHVELLVGAIGAGRLRKIRRGRGARHPREELCQRCTDVLAAWCSGSLGEAAGIEIAGIAAKKLVSYIGVRTRLKVWQVERICDKFRSFLSPTLNYVEMVDHPGHYHPGRYGATYGYHAEFRELTMQTIIHDTQDGQDTEISLASAIDHLQPCNWSFVQNLAIVLRAIGGDCFPETPLAAHARNLELSPIRQRMNVVANALRSFCKGATGPRT